MLIGEIETRVMNVKNCPRCNNIKTASEFYKDKDRKDGLAGWCKKCAYKATRKWHTKKLSNNLDYAQKIKDDRADYQEKHRDRWVIYHKHHAEKMKQWYDAYKSKICCELCGESHVACLDFHHKNTNEKKFGIAHRYQVKSIETLIKEIKSVVFFVLIAIENYTMI